MAQKQSKSSTGTANVKKSGVRSSIHSNHSSGSAGVGGNSAGTSKRSPKVSELGKSPLAVAFRHLEPNWRSYIAYVDYAANDGNEDMKKIIDIFRALPQSERKKVMPETLCDLAGVRPSEVIGAVTAQVWALQSGESAMAAAILHPKVIKATGKAALNVKRGFKDRELFLRSTGSLPDKKGTSITINNTPQTANINTLPALSSGKFLPMSDACKEMDDLIEPVEIKQLTAPVEEIEIADV